MRRVYVDTDALWERKRLGDPRALEQLVDRYGSLVGETCCRIVPSNFRSRDIAIEDLRQEGFIGLIRALDQYDFRKNVKFESYAISIIRGAILDALRTTDPVPRLVRERDRALEAHKEAACVKLGKPYCTDQELAASMGVSVDTLTMYQNSGVIRRLLSLEEPVEESSNGRLHLRGEDVASSDPSPEEMTMVSLSNLRLFEAICALAPMKQTTLLLRYYDQWTLKRIAAFIRRSEARVNQLNREAIIDLRRYFGHPTDLACTRLPVVRTRSQQPVTR